MGVQELHAVSHQTLSGCYVAAAACDTLEAMRSKS